MDIDAESGKAFLRRHSDLAERLYAQATMHLLSVTLAEMSKEFAFDFAPTASEMVGRMLESWLADHRILSYRMTVEGSRIVVEVALPRAAHHIDLNFQIGA